MKARQAVVCPKCGALNRPTWEFCARCNESLEGALPAEEGAAPVEEGPAPSAVPTNALALATLAVVVGLGIAGWRYASQAPPLDAPDPSLFTVATRPAELPAAPPPTGAGAADYDAGRRLMNSGDLAGAVERLADAVAADPDNAEYQSVYGHALWRSGDQEAALAAHAEAARLDPRLQMQYARSLDIAGRPADAAREYEEILAQNPTATTVQNGPRTAVLPERGLREGRPAAAAGCGSQAGRPGPGPGARLLARPGGRPRAGRRRLPAGSWRGCRRRSWRGDSWPRTWSRRGRRRRP